MESISNILNDCFFTELKDTNWINMLNSMSYIPLLNNPPIINSNSCTLSKQPKKEGKKGGKETKIICSINKCTFKDYKETFCRLHYNKSHNLLCSIKKCNNLKRKNDLCYKHIKPLCCIMRCKCYAIAKDVLCIKHKKFKIELYKTNI